MSLVKSVAGFAINLAQESLDVEAKLAESIPATRSIQSFSCVYILLIDISRWTDAVTASSRAVFFSLTMMSAGVVFES